MTKFATTLACQLAAAIPEAAPFIEKAAKAEPGLLQSSLVSQLRRLVYEPFKAATKRGRLLGTTLLKGPFLVVVDGLDECEDRQNVQAFISDMLEFFKKNPLVPLRFLITSRVEQHIQSHLKNDHVRLENLTNHCSRDDIDTFMTTCFEAEKSRNSVVKTYIEKHGDWPTKEDKDQLVDHIGGSFIFASALFKYIVDPTNKQSTPMERLPHTLNMNPGLDTLYTHTLSRSQGLPYFSDIISTLALLFEPLPIAGIAELLGIEPFEVVRVLVDLQAIIHIPGTDDLPVTMCHTSLRDFLTTESRSGCFFTPPSYHIYLLYRCSTLHDGRQFDTAAALYGIGHFAEHFEQFIRLPSSAQGPFPRFPQTLDALYGHILAQSKELPHFSDVVSTIALVPEPLSIAEITELLGLGASEASRVLASLQVIISNPGIDSTEPVTVRHKSLRDFLRTETRSGAHFVPPSYHLKLSYRCFSLNFERLLSNGPSSPGRQYGKEHSQHHWNQFLDGIPKQSSILAELRQLPHLPHPILSYHLCSFIQIFFLLFEDHSKKTRQVLHALTESIKFLALALECDAAPDRWLQKSFYELGFGGCLRGDAYRVKIQQEDATSLQRNVYRIKKAITTKCPSSNRDINHFSSRPVAMRASRVARSTQFPQWLDSWTPMEAYRFFKWMNGQIKAEMKLAKPGVPCEFDLGLTCSGPAPSTSSHLPM